MNAGSLTGDRIVALIGIAMAPVLLSRNGALQRLTHSRRIGYAVFWAVCLGVAAALAARYGG